MKKNNFTLLEVVVAVAILALVMMSVLTIVGMAKLRSLTAARMQKEHHMLLQATEYWLLDSTVKDLPEEFFPYVGYTAERELKETKSLPKRISAQRGQWRLTDMTVNLLKNGEICQTITVECITQNND